MLLVLHSLTSADAFRMNSIFQSYSSTGPSRKGVILYYNPSNTSSLSIKPIAEVGGRIDREEKRNMIYIKQLLSDAKHY